MVDDKKADGDSKSEDDDTDTRERSVGHKSSRESTEILTWDELEPYRSERTKHKKRKSNKSDSVSLMAKEDVTNDKTNVYCPQSSSSSGRYWR